MLVRPSSRVLGTLLRMTCFLNLIINLRHPEEPAERASRRTYDPHADSPLAAVFLTTGQGSPPRLMPRGSGGCNGDYGADTRSGNRRGIAPLAERRAGPRLFLDGRRDLCGRLYRLGRVVVARPRRSAREAD